VRAELRGLLFLDDAHGLGQGGALDPVGQLAGQELVHHDPQRVDVRAPVDGRGVAARLLGAHVGERAHQRAHVRLQGRRARLVVGQARHAEVEDLGLAICRDQDVAGLEVAVDHALLVRVVDGVGDARREIEALAHGGRAPRGPGVEALALDVLHGDVRQHALVGRVGADLVDLRDARVVQARQDLGLLLEAVQRARREHGRVDHLERHGARGPLLLRQEDHAHPALAELAQDLERPDRARRLGQPEARRRGRRQRLAGVLGSRGHERPSLARRPMDG
jgi:hypothetical protein